jgi:hypothetical protein
MYYAAYFTMQGYLRFAAEGGAVDRDGLDRAIEYPDEGSALAVAARLAAAEVGRKAIRGKEYTAIPVR